MILKGSLRRWVPYRLREVMLVLSSVNWHFPFKTASLCEWAVGVGCLFSFFFLNQPSLSLWHHSPVRSWGRNFIQRAKKKWRLLWKTTFWGFTSEFTGTERERERKGKLRFKISDLWLVSVLSLYHLMLGGVFKIPFFPMMAMEFVALWLVCSL